MRFMHLTLLVLFFLASAIPNVPAEEQPVLTAEQIQALPQAQLENNVRHYYLKDDMKNLEIALQELERRMPDHHLVTLYRGFLKTRAAMPESPQKTSTTVATQEPEKTVLPDKPLDVSVPGVAAPATASSSTLPGTVPTTAETQAVSKEAHKSSAATFALYAVIGAGVLVLLFVVIKVASSLSGGVQRSSRDDVFSGPLGDNTSPQANDFSMITQSNGGMTQLPVDSAKAGMSLEDIRLHFGDTTPPVASEENYLSDKMDDGAQITLMDSENNVDYNQVTLMDESDQMTLMDFSNQLTIADTDDAPAAPVAPAPPAPVQDDNLPLDLGLGLDDSSNVNPLDLFDNPPSKTVTPPAPPTAPDELDALVSGMADAQAHAPDDALFDANNEITIILEPEPKKKA